MRSIAEHQASLALRVIREPVERLSDAQVAELPTLTAACFKCIGESGLQDKSICIELDIDPGVFSRARTGQANFPPDKINELMDLCGNEIPLRWLALRRGYGMVKLKSALEAENEKLRAQVVEQQKELETITKLCSSGAHMTLQAAIHCYSFCREIGNKPAALRHLRRVRAELRWQRAVARFRKTHLENTLKQYSVCEISQTAGDRITSIFDV